MNKLDRIISDLFGIMLIIAMACTLTALVFALIKSIQPERKEWKAKPMVCQIYK